jgi:vacuolar protein sorting-associated protein 8
MTLLVSLALFLFVLLLMNYFIAKAAGAVTAVALSHDHTFVASGHAAGYILLYDLKSPKNPVRTVVPASLAKVQTGRYEGHISGSRIISIGFIAGRHTAIVSADDRGLSFYHSLGKVLFVEASDTLRILGKYPDEPSANAKLRPSKGSSSSIHPPQAEAPTPFTRRRQQAPNAILAMSPLPLGTVPHPTDAYQVVAVLTPAKLVIVGLKPTAKTWYRRHRPEVTLSPQSRWKGCMAWFPCTSLSPEFGNGKTSHRNGHRSNAETTSPILAHSWGDTIYLLCVIETKTRKKVQNPRSGQVREVEEGVLTFDERPSWRASGLVLGLQWLNNNVSIMRIVRVFLG